MNATTSAIVGDALAAAVRAPSPLNTQPWSFEVDRDRIRLRLDRSRVLPVSDPDAREARLSCGAALSNLRIALRGRHRLSFVDLLPDRDDPDLLAVIRLAGERSATTTEQRLADAIGQRYTSPHPFLERPVPMTARAALSSAARIEGARLLFVDAPERYGLLVRLIQAAEQVQDQSGAYRREFRRWLDALAARTEEPDDGEEPVTGKLLTLRGQYRPSPIPPRLGERQPALVAVTTQVAGERHDILAGAGMQRAVLTACVLGLSASFISQPFEVPATRAELAAAFRGEGEVHTLFRVGYGFPAGTPAPRSAEVSVPNAELPG